MTARRAGRSSHGGAGGGRAPAARRERGPLAGRPLAAALIAVAACGGDGGGGGTGPPPPDLRDRAVAAGLAPMPTEPVRPVENAYLAERVELGHLLFFDPILSGPRDVACSTCHLPRFAFTDGRQFPAGVGADGLGPDRTEPGPPPLRPMPRNSPTILNAGLFGRMSPAPSINGTMFWGGSAFGIEDQTLAPLAADNEMRGLTYERKDAQDSVIARLRSSAPYVELFSTAYPELAIEVGADPERLVTPTTTRRALAAYIRELVTPVAPLDRFLRGEDGALTAGQKDGLELFIGKAGCVACHTGPLLSDFDMHVLGAPQEGIGRDSTPGDDLGWGEHGGTPYSFRTPPLRQVALTAPYFHAGTHATLPDVLRFKNRGQSAHPSVPDGDLDADAGPLGLSEPELARLADFLLALTDTLTIQGPLFHAPAALPSGLEPPH